MMANPTNRSLKTNQRYAILFAVVFVVVLASTEFRPVLFGETKKRGIDEATELICSKVLLTRQKAVAGKTYYRIRYDYVHGKCHVYCEETPGRWVLDSTDDRCEIPVGVSISPSSTPSNGFIEISPEGDVDNHGVPVILRLTDRDGTLKSIRISPSGMVQELPTW
jgi:hypothetical protein